MPTTITILSINRIVFIKIIYVPYLTIQKIIPDTIPAEIIILAKGHTSIPIAPSAIPTAIGAVVKKIPNNQLNLFDI